MNKIDRIEKRKPVLLDVVALLANVPAEKDDEGRAHAITPVKFKDLLVLHYLPKAA